jgi:16S rRNA (cytidine1402-2'-O)-methyltransferase
MKETKRQDLPSGLWVVATPIGNLGDITPRALQALRNADRILCEDTRRTGVLLSALGITESQGRLERLDAHTHPQKLDEWIEKIQSGESYALVTDAGTPAISDPGSALVAIAREKGVHVTPLPGASAVVTLLSISGFQGAAFTFRGFFPRKRSDQTEELEVASTFSLSQIYVWFESPLRIEESLAVIGELYPDALVLAAKELTKLFERTFSGKAADVATQVKEEVQREGTIGEWCFAVQFPKSSPTETSDWIKALRCLLDAGISVSEASKRVSQVFGISKKVAYEASLKISGKKNEGGD